MNKNYKILGTIGQGMYGQVVKAKSRETGKVFAIKYIKDVQKDTIMARLVVRELMILRKLGDTNKSSFHTILHDIILPEGVVLENREDGKIKVSFDQLTHVFMVLEYIESDLKKLISIA